MCDCIVNKAINRIFLISKRSYSELMAVLLVKNNNLIKNAFKAGVIKLFRMPICGHGKKLSMSSLEMHFLVRFLYISFLTSNTAISSLYVRLDIKNIRFIAFFTIQSHTRFKKGRFG